jgi:hypothetical protein
MFVLADPSALITKMSDVPSAASIPEYTMFPESALVPAEPGAGEDAGDDGSQSARTAIPRLCMLVPPRD